MKSLNNDLVQGASGRIGDMLVFRQVANQTIISKRPRKKKTPDTLKQVAVKEKFSEGVIYAKRAIEDETLKEMYQEKAGPGLSVFNIALSDYCKSPEIKQITATSYNGIPGDKIIIRAVDDFRVKSVDVQIIAADSTVLEEGSAELSLTGIDWVYIAVQTINDLAGVSVCVSAKDVALNVTSKTIDL